MEWSPAALEERQLITHQLFPQRPAIHSLNFISIPFREFIFFAERWLVGHSPFAAASEPDELIEFHYIPFNKFIPFRCCSGIARHLISIALPSSINLFINFKDWLLAEGMKIDWRSIKYCYNIFSFSSIHFIQERNERNQWK